MNVYAPDGTKLEHRIVLKHEVDALLLDGWDWVDTWPGKPDFYLMVKQP